MKTITLTEKQEKYLVRLLDEDLRQPRQRRQASGIHINEIYKQLTGKCHLNWKD